MSSPRRRGATTDILTILVLTAANKRTDSTLSADTTSMVKLIDQLNDPAVSKKIVSDFVDLLKIDKNKDSRFEPNNSLSDNLVKFKFEAKDFSGFLRKQQERVKNTHEKEGFAAQNPRKEINKKEQVGKNILQKKEGTKADIVKASMNNPQTRYH